MITLEELKLRLAKQLDEVSLVEELGITSDDIVDRFEDLIQEDFSRLAALVEGEQEQDEDDE